jgi:hypothetical protein
MRIYILVEGRRTEAKVYPAWIAHRIPALSRVRNHDDETDNSYFLLSAEGYPSIYEYLVDAIADVNTTGNYDYLMVCLDSDEDSVDERIKEVNALLMERGVALKAAELVVIVQNRCIETWFLGNRRIIKRNPQGPVLRAYLRHYNVITNDPEGMSAHPAFSTQAQFHLHYLKEIFSERGLSYSKKKPGNVMELHFLNELQRRVADEPAHLPSLRTLLEFLEELNTELMSKRAPEH